MNSNTLPSKGLTQVAFKGQVPFTALYLGQFRTYDFDKKKGLGSQNIVYKKIGCAKVHQTVGILNKI
jgi:hypothetical protein